MEQKSLCLYTGAASGVAARFQCGKWWCETRACVCGGPGVISGNGVQEYLLSSQLMVFSIQRGIEAMEFFLPDKVVV